jgi:hypothetical protein
MGPADQRVQDPEPQGDGQIHRAEAEKIASSFQFPASSLTGAERTGNR